MCQRNAGALHINGAFNSRREHPTRTRGQAIVSRRMSISFFQIQLSKEACFRHAFVRMQRCSLMFSGGNHATRESSRPAPSSSAKSDHARKSGTGLRGRASLICGRRGGAQLSWTDLVDKAGQIFEPQSGCESARALFNFLRCAHDLLAAGRAQTTVAPERKSRMNRLSALSATARVRDRFHWLIQDNLEVDEYIEGKNVRLRTP